jgi:hypothetical protein
MNADSRNPFYLLLLIASVAFAVTAVAYALPLRMLPEWFQAHGWKLLLVEVGAVVILGLASMGLDRWRQGGGTRASGIAKPVDSVEHQRVGSEGDSG